MATHDHHAHHAPSSDKGAAYVGLFGGLVFVLIVVYAVVQLTNKKFEGHAPAGTPAAQTTGH